MKRHAIVLAAALFAIGCPSGPPDGTAPETPPTTLAPASPTPTPMPMKDPREALRPVEDAVTLLDGGALPALRRSVDRSLSWLKVQPRGRRLVFGTRTVTARELQDSLVAFRKMLADNPSPEVLSERVLAAFDVMESVGREDGSPVLFTGYYEPIIEGSLRKRPGYDVPIYRRPNDFVEIAIGEWGGDFQGHRTIVGRLDGRRVRPYFDREEIGWGSLEGKKLEIAWAKDPVDLFFLEIQGSGALRLPDGKIRRIGYAGSNGRPYRSIGSLLIGEEAIPAGEMSMQSLRRWLDENPEERTRVLEHNESYVFFRFLEGGPVGSLGREVTAERSIATDQSLFPPAALAFVQTEFPQMVTGTDGATTIAWSPLQRFVLNQDAGGAIKGAGRVDVFWGQGEHAELAAGMMKQRGRLFFLVPKSVAADGAFAKP